MGKKILCWFGHDWHRLTEKYHTVLFEGQDNYKQNYSYFECRRCGKRKPMPVYGLRPWMLCVKASGNTNVFWEREILPKRGDR